MIKTKFFRFAEIVHLRLFGHSMSAEMRIFLGNLSWSFFGGVIAAGVMFIVNIIAGRWLGPEQYGKYSLVFLISQVLLIPMIFGMDTTISRIVSKEFSWNFGSVQRNISSAFWFVIAISALFLIVSIIWRDFLANIFSSTTDVVLFGALFGFVLALKTYLDSVVKGFHLFSFQAKIRILESLLIIAIFFGSYNLFKNYISLVVALIFSGLIVVSRYFFRFREHILSVPNSASLINLLQYSKFAIATALLTLIVGYGDRFVVNRYFGAGEFGLYSAYYAATVFVSGQVTVIMSNVFFPFISKIERQFLIMKKIDKLAFIGTVPFVALIFFVGLLVFRLFGPEYEINLTVLFLFSLVATLQFFVAFYGNAVAAHSPESYYLGLKFYFMRACIYTGYIGFLIATNTLSMLTLLAGLSANYLIDGFNLRFILKKHC